MLIQFPFVMEVTLQIIDFDSFC